MQTVLFLSSAPHHTLWYLGLAVGPFREARCVLIQTHWRKDRRDYLMETLETDSQGLFRELKSFPKLVSSARDRFLHGRRVLNSLSGYVRQVEPDRIIVGSDSHPEFYAALRGSPGAACAYVDDGWGSYRGTDTNVSAVIAWRRIKAQLSIWARRVSFGVDNERPLRIGGSRAVREAWVIAPKFVHGELAAKRLHTIESAWFHDTRVVAACSAAVRRSGLDPECLTRVGLVLVLPHPAFLRRHPQLYGPIEQLASDCARRGKLIAVKHHPRARADGLQLPAANSVEIPQRLPAEILAPLISDTLVVGAMTSTLIFLPRLNSRIRVQALTPPASANDPVTHIYRAMGVGILESTKENIKNEPVVHT